MSGWNFVLSLTIWHSHGILEVKKMWICIRISADDKHQNVIQHANSQHFIACKLMFENNVCWYFTYKVDEYHVRIQWRAGGPDPLKSQK